MSSTASGVENGGLPVRQPRNEPSWSRVSLSREGRSAGLHRLRDRIALASAAKPQALRAALAVLSAAPKGNGST